MTALNLRPGSGPPQTSLRSWPIVSLADLELVVARAAARGPQTQRMRVPVLFGVPILA